MEIKIKCENCCIAFEEKEDFILHSQKLNQTKYFCTICRLKFSTKCKAYVHNKKCVNHIARIHEAEESEISQFSCNKCSSVYKYEYDLVLHEIRKHPFLKVEQNTMPSVFEMNKTNEDLEVQILDTSEESNEIKIEIREEWNQNDFVSSNNF